MRMQVQARIDQDEALTKESLPQELLALEEDLLNWDHGHCDLPAEVVRCKEQQDREVARLAGN